MESELLTDPAVAADLRAFLRDRIGGEDWTWDRPSRGRKTPIALARCGERQVVVRVMPHWLNLLRIRPIQRRMAALGLPVPRLLALGWGTPLGGERGYLIVEERMPGVTIGDVRGPDRLPALLAVADVMALQHSVRRARRGWMVCGLPGSAALAELRRGRDRWARLARVLDGTRLARLRGGLVAAADAIGRRDMHELVHGHVNPSNFLVSDGRASIIDLEVVHFGDAAKDLVAAEHRLCLDDAATTSAFLARYFERVRGFTREDWVRQRPFYEAEFRVARLAGLARGSKDQEERVEREIAAAFLALDRATAA